MIARCAMTIHAICIALQIGFCINRLLLHPGDATPIWLGMMLALNVGCALSSYRMLRQP